MQREGRQNEIWRITDEIPVAEETMRLLWRSVIAGTEFFHQSSRIHTLLKALAFRTNRSHLLHFRDINNNSLISKKRHDMRPPMAVSR